VSDINTAVVDSLKVLDLKRPIREADKTTASPFVVYWTNNGQRAALGLIGSAANDPKQTIGISRADQIDAKLSLERKHEPA
jgi:hypothetical protein